MRFTTDLDIRLIDPLAKDGQGIWMLLADLKFIDSKGIEHTAPAGFKTDLSSVPRRPIAYLMYGNTAHGPGAIHDWLLTSGTVTREYADEVFREAMESIGMPNSRIGPMYRAVKGETAMIASRPGPFKPIFSQSES